MELLHAVSSLVVGVLAAVALLRLLLLLLLLGLLYLVEVSLPLHLVRVGLRDVLWIVIWLLVVDQELLAVCRDLQ